MTQEQENAIKSLSVAELIDAYQQIAEWAMAYVEGETVIPEVPVNKLSDAERNALLILRAKT